MPKSPYYMMSCINTLGGTADAPDEYYMERYEEIKTMHIAPFSFKLDNNIFEDFIMNNLDYPLISESLKSIFDRYKSHGPPYKSIPVKVIANNGKIEFEYYLLVFLEKPDVLDLDKTEFIDDDYVYPYFSFDKIKSYEFFPPPRDLDGSLFVSGRLKRIIEDECISGVEFEKANIVYN